MVNGEVMGGGKGREGTCCRVRNRENLMGKGRESDLRESVKRNK